MSGWMGLSRTSVVYTLFLHDSECLDMSQNSAKPYGMRNVSGGVGCGDTHRLLQQTRSSQNGWNWWRHLCQCMA